jgi:hypothetical protein
MAGNNAAREGANILRITGGRAWNSHTSTPDNPRRFATLLLVVIIMTALTWLCVGAAAALRDARRSAPCRKPVFMSYELLRPWMF